VVGNGVTLTNDVYSMLMTIPRLSGKDNGFTTYEDTQQTHKIQ
jgi:hypothetical protein